MVVQIVPNTSLHTCRHWRKLTMTIAIMSATLMQHARSVTNMLMPFEHMLCLWALRFHFWVAVLVVKVIHARAYHARIAADISWKFTSDLSLSSMLADSCRLICMLQFKRIEEIEGMPANTLLDVLGILESVGDFATLTLKNATEQTKRSVVLRDNSNRSIELTLWGSFASDPGDQLAQVRALLCWQ